MELLLERKWLKDKYTIGRLYVDSVFFCNILEDKVIDFNKNGTFDCGELKIKGHTAIPYGVYKIDITYSPKFKRDLPILLNVPHFEGIRIHRGNTPEDTEGCLIPGENKEVGKVLNSTKYEIELIKLMKQAKLNNEIITIKIV